MTRIDASKNMIVSAGRIRNLPAAQDSREERRAGAVSPSSSKADARRPNK